MNETRFVNECQTTGASERFCECLLFQLKDAGVGRSEVNRQTGARAGFICGAQGEL